MIAIRIEGQETINSGRDPFLYFYLTPDGAAYVIVLEEHWSIEDKAHFVRQDGSLFGEEDFVNERYFRVAAAMMLRPPGDWDEEANLNFVDRTKEIQFQQSLIENLYFTPKKHLTTDDVLVGTADIVTEIGLNLIPLYTANEHRKKGEYFQMSIALAGDAATVITLGGWSAVRASTHGARLFKW